MFKIFEYHWSAVNRFEQKQKGRQLAKSYDDLEQKLLAKGFSSIKISRNFVLPTAPKSEEITQIFSQLAMLMNAKIPLKQSLSMLLENCSNIKLYLWLLALISAIEAGYSLSKALVQQGKYVTNSEIQLIKMGEMSGKLDLVLSNITKAREESEKLQKKVKKVMFYPVVILSISIILSLGLLIFIVPQFVELYNTKDRSLPWITEILFNLSEFLKNNLMSIGIILLLVLCLGIPLLKQKWFLSFIRTKIFFNIPMFNHIIKSNRIIYFYQNIALMLNAHIRLDMILNSFLSEKSNDPILQEEIKSILNVLNRGYKFSEGLSLNVSTHQIIQMIAIGEQSGNLAAMCEYVSRLYKQKLDYQIDLLSQLLEPILMLIMGIIVGGIMLGLYLPIFDMGSLVA